MSDCMHSKFMKEAIKQARKASAIGDVPIGCVIVYQDQIIARAYNRRNADKSTLAHAEILAIKKACKKRNDWRLEECTMYITLEPCPMCAGAILQARIPNLVIGSTNPKAGCAGSVLDLLHVDTFNHQVDVTILDDELHETCQSLMTDFFKQLRIQKQQAKLGEHE